MRAKRPCSMGCGRPAEPGGKCVECRARQRRHTDQRRGSSTERGYDEAHRRFRQAVLERDRYTCRHCGGRATVADHAPLERRELVERGLDPNCPDFGQALCASCHNSKTDKTTAKHNLPTSFDR